MFVQKLEQCPEESLGRNSFFGKTLKVCQGLNENNWAKMSEMHSTSREYYFGMIFFEKVMNYAEVSGEKYF